jgi:hypothetical protein
MNLNKRFVVAIAVAFIALIVGCSGSNPTAPQGTEAGSIDSLPVIGLTSTEDMYNAVGLMGAYEVSVDLEEMTAELVSKRYSAIGESLLVNGINFFTNGVFCGTCVQLTAVEWSPEGYVVLSYDVRHPFQLGDPASPPTGRNRADLDVFDLALVVDDDNDVAKIIPQLVQGVRAKTYVKAAGYTRELEDIVNHQDALPFYLVVDDAETGTSTWNEFPMGGSGSTMIYIDYQGTKLNFDLFLTIAYGAAARKATFFEPRYFNPEFNRKNAWKVDVTVPWGDDDPTMLNAWLSNDFTTELPVIVEVYDWQQGANVYAGTDFEGEALLSDVYEASGVKSVKLVVPGNSISETMFDDAKVMLAADSGTGMPGDPLVYTFNVANENELPAGAYIGFIEVLDERSPASSVMSSRDILIDVDGSLGQHLETMPEYSTYQAFPVYILTPCGPISGVIDTPGPFSIASGSTLDFEVTGTSGNGGHVILYEIDWNYNGTTFVSRDTSANGAFEDVGPFVYSNGPVQTVAFRITDDCEDFRGNPNVLILTETITVNVMNCANVDINTWNFDTCTSIAYTCDGWTAGGCGLPNTDSYSWGEFKWGCVATGISCGDIAGGYITTGGDSGGCSFLTDYGGIATYNVVSSDISMPNLSTYDFVTFQFETCDAWCATAFFRAYYHAGLGCPAVGDWIQIFEQDGTFGGNWCGVSEVNIDTYAVGGFGRFRFEFNDTGAACGGGSCGNTGVVIDNVKIVGCQGL